MFCNINTFYLAQNVGKQLRMLHFYRLMMGKHEVKIQKEL